MLANVIRSAAIAATFLPGLASAEPITLKLSYFSSDRSLVNQRVIKPFVDAVNADGKDLVRIETYFSGALGKGQARQPGLVEEGIADIAFVVIGQNPELFPDQAVIELPGLFRDTHEASLVYSRLIATNAMRGYENYFVIASFAAYDPCCINTRSPISSLADLRGKKIRANNMMEATALQSLGVVPVVIAANQLLDAVSSGAIDGASLPPSVLFDFGLGRVATHHYVVAASAAPMALVMSRRAFDSLPEAAKAIIRKHSGPAASRRWADTFQGLEREALEQIKAAPSRQVVSPSSTERREIKHAYKGVVSEWAETSVRNRELLRRVQAELVAIRAGE